MTEDNSAGYIITDSNVYKEVLGSIYKTSNIQVPDLLPADNIDEKDSLLPLSIRWISDDKRKVVFERPPTRQLITFYGVPKASIDYSHVIEQKFELPLPWQIYLASFDSYYHVMSLSLFFRQQELTSLRSILDVATLPNIFNDYGFCKPDNVVDYGVKQNLMDGIVETMQIVWGSSYNLDLVHMINMATEQKRPDALFVEDYKLFGNADLRNRAAAEFLYRWEQHDIIDVVDWHWPSTGKTVSQMLDTFAGTPGAGARALSASSDLLKWMKTNLSNAQWETVD